MFGPDGQMDAIFTVTLQSGSGNRTATSLELSNDIGGVWDTVPNNGFRALGAASTLDGALYNGANGVNFAVADGGRFYIFASDYWRNPFSAGSTLNLVANFADGSSATEQAVLP